MEGPNEKALAERLREMDVPEDLVQMQIAKIAPPTELAIWPENDSIVRAFCAVASTQWNAVGTMAGVVRTGLRYEVLPFVLRVLEIPRKEWPEVFWGLRVMEQAVLKSLAERARRVGAKRGPR